MKQTKKKIINSIFTHADKCTDEKSRRVKCCVWHTAILVLSEPSTFKIFQKYRKKICISIKKKFKRSAYTTVVNKTKENLSSNFKLKPIVAI